MKFFFSKTRRRSLPDQLLENLAAIEVIINDAETFTPHLQFSTFSFQIFGYNSLVSSIRRYRNKYLYL